MDPRPKHLKTAILKETLIINGKRKAHQIVFPSAAAKCVFKVKAGGAWTGGDTGEWQKLTTHQKLAIGLNQTCALIK